MARGSKPGERRGGRRAGTPNKTTASVKAALVAAFDDLGGVESLVSWGRRNRTEFYKLWAKLLPAEVQLSGQDGEPIQIAFIEINRVNRDDDAKPAADPASEESAGAGEAGPAAGVPV